MPTPAASAAPATPPSVAMVNFIRRCQTRWPLRISIIGSISSTGGSTPHPAAHWSELIRSSSLYPTTGQRVGFSLLAACLPRHTWSYLMCDTPVLKDLREDVGPVAHQAIHAVAQQPLHGDAIIHGPDMDGETHLMRRAHRRRRDDWDAAIRLGDLQGVVG